MKHELTQAKINILKALLDKVGNGKTNGSSDRTIDVWVDSIETPDAVRNWVAMLFLSDELAYLTNILKLVDIKAMNWRNLNGSASYHLFFSISSGLTGPEYLLAEKLTRDVATLNVQLGKELKELEKELD